MGKIFEVVDERVREEKKLFIRSQKQSDKDHSLGSCEASLGS